MPRSSQEESRLASRPKTAPAAVGALKMAEGPARHPQGLGGGGDVGSTPARTGIRATGERDGRITNRSASARGFLRAEQAPRGGQEPSACPGTSRRSQWAVLLRSATDRPSSNGRRRPPLAPRGRAGRAPPQGMRPRAVDVLPRGTGVWMALGGGRDRGEASFREGLPGGRGGQKTNRTARDPEGASSCGTTSDGTTSRGTEATSFPPCPSPRPGAASPGLSDEGVVVPPRMAAARTSRLALVLRKRRRRASHTC